MLWDFCTFPTHSISLGKSKKRKEVEKSTVFFYDEKFRRISSKNIFKKNFEKGIDFSKKSVIIIIVKRKGHREFQEVATLRK